jgi:hypothetical protein
MYKIAIIAAVLSPAVAAAQATVSAKSQTSAEARAGRSNAQASSTEPIRRRAAEGRAKGATEAEVALAARRVRMNLEAAHSAMVRAGRSRPSDQETEQGGTVIERGYTSAQVEAIVRSAPSDRSLVVAFDVLTKLAARGMETGKALATVQSRLEARASDAQISALVRGNANSGAAANGFGSNTAAGANAAVGAAASATKGAASATGGVAGTVGGVIKP